MPVVWLTFMLLILLSWPPGSFFLSTSCDFAPWRKSNGSFGWPRVIIQFMAGQSGHIPRACLDPPCPAHSVSWKLVPKRLRHSQDWNRTGLTWVAWYSTSRGFYDIPKQIEDDDLQQVSVSDFSVLIASWRWEGQGWRSNPLRKMGEVKNGQDFVNHYPN